MRLDRFVPGFQYEVGNVFGAYLVAEGWAEPVDAFGSALVIPLDDFETEDDDATDQPANLKRELFPPYYDGPPVALDRRRRRRVRN